MSADKLLEEVPGVVGAGRGLRVILYAEEGKLGMPESLDGIVVEIEMGDLGVRGQSVRVHRETVVL